ncbi:MAG: phosphoribosylanthranilate isomerase [Lachnospiraceae bacterium]|nr:phosphoribosylanthranilate isomerase [Lachnospiraceae bacterium]
MMKVKFCGIKRIEDINMCNALVPDFIGFIFWDKSKRNISMDKAKELKLVLDKRIKVVGVFVDEDIDNIINFSNQNIMDIIQLHGNENNKYIKYLQDTTKKPIIKAFKIISHDDIINANESVADYVMLDNGYGTGKSFDWNLIKNVKRDYFLAGGLNVNNVEEAITKLKPFAVDVSSGIETDGVKDELKMQEFLKIVRNK